MTPQRFDFDVIDAGDGYRVERTDLAGELSLFVTFHQNGELYPTVNTNESSREIYTWLNPTEMDEGACTRLQIFLEAACRFLSTGGSWVEMDNALNRLRPFITPLCYPGWYYYDGYPNEQGNFDHVFATETRLPGEMKTLGVLWKEDDFIEPPQPLHQLMESLDESAERTEGGEVEPLDPANPAPPQLPYRDPPA